MADYARSDSAAVQAQLNRLGTLSPGRDTLGLERIYALCDRLGNPQDRLPPVFHVAGTNGKGSTCAFLRAMLEAAGHRVHVYTSPHLVRFNERIRLAGTLIDDANLAATLARVLDVAEGLDASFFEITTAAAFLRFAQVPADACVIEVGLGGRLDATNIIAKPLVCGIASLGIDHEAFLLAPDAEVPDMPPLERIAFEKAGIAKPGVPLVTMDYPSAMADCIAAHAAHIGAPLFAKNAVGGWAAKPGSGDRHLVYGEGEDCYFHGPPPAMSGRHQISNAGLAIAMLRRQNILAVDEAAMQVGIVTARWPARMQRLRDGPLTALVPEAEIWLDGGHNLDAAEQVAKMLADITAVLQVKCNVILGMLVNKDAVGFIAQIAPYCHSLRAVPIPGHAHHAPWDLAMMAKTAGIATVGTAPDVMTAIEETEHRSRPGENYAPILICGSLYLAGDVLRLNDELPD